MPNIESKPGDATSPLPNQHGVIIAHLVNASGRWGKGFAAALDKISEAPKAAYIAWGKLHNGSIPLGDVQFVETCPGKFVANMCAQSDKASGTSVDYAALERCLKLTFLRALRWGYDVHIPAGIGSGAAGGDRQKIHDLIKTVAQQAERGKFATRWSEHNDPLKLNVTLWELPAAGAAPAPSLGQAPTKVTTAAADLDDEL